MLALKVLLFSASKPIVQVHSGPLKTATTPSPTTWTPTATCGPICPNKAEVVNELLGLHVYGIFGVSDLTKADLNKPVNRAHATELVTLVYSLSDMNADAIREYNKVNNTSGGYAAGAKMRAQQAVANGRKEWTWDDIPDGELAKQVGQISVSETVDEKFIPLAYTIGIVKGVDSIGTLNAGVGLTRAEFCQMLYNAGIFGCTYPVFVGSSTKLLNYMEGHYTDGTPVEGYEHIGGPTFG